jgi:DNA-binding PadR family transcriptional regulator
LLYLSVYIRVRIFISGQLMAKPTHPSNPLALAVLALLFERPMHPYEMGVILKQRHKEESIKLRYGSLYTVIDLLLKRGLIVAKEIARDGRRPERTVYDITPAGRDELRIWMADLVGQQHRQQAERRFEPRIFLDRLAGAAAGRGARALASAIAADRTERRDAGAADR